MKFTVHLESIGLLKEALECNCDGIAFGGEFCEWKIPTLNDLKNIYENVIKNDKKFVYMTSILSNIGIDKLRDQITFLKDRGNAEVVIGDFGLLNLLSDYNGLTLRLGRPRVYIPGRCPWSQITRTPNPSFITRYNIEKIFYQTNLNYLRTLELYKNYGIFNANVDWIPKVFPYYKTIIKNGFKLSVYTHVIPVAITMKCHMARFLNETEPEFCTKPCLNKSFKIHQNEVQCDYTLHGNVVFRNIKINKSGVKELQRIGIEELIIPMGPISGLYTKKDVNNFISILLGEV